MSNLEYRKLIKFGNSSHVMSIPTSWLKKNNLNKGDLIYFKENSNNELILSPELKQEEPKDKAITIETKHKDIETVRREIFSAYINNYNTINVVGKGISNNSEFLRDLLDKLVGLEVVEQTSESIIAKDFLNIKEVSIKEIVRKIDIITRSMLHDSVESLNKSLYDSIYQRDNDVNRLTYLVHKVIKVALNNHAIYEHFNIKHDKLVDCWRLTIYLEKIADITKRIARNFKKLKISKEEAKRLKQIYSEIEKEYWSVMKSHFNNDKKLAYETIARRASILKKCDEFFKRNYNKPGVPDVVEGLKGMETEIRDIARIIACN